MLLVLALTCMLDWERGEVGRKYRNVLYARNNEFKCAQKSAKDVYLVGAYLMGDILTVTYNRQHITQQVRNGNKSPSGVCSGI